MYNPDENELEEIMRKNNEGKAEPSDFADAKQQSEEFVRKDGSPVPKGAAIFSVGQEFELNGVVFRVKNIRRKRLDLEPVRPATIEER